MEEMQLKKKVDHMILRLSQPLLPQDIKDGWTEQAQKAMLEVFTEFRETIKSPEWQHKEDKYIGMARGMDTWGVVNGELLDLAVEIDNAYGD